MATSVIERIEKHAKKIASGKHKRVKPGMPVRFSEAASVGDCVRQGDLYLTIVESVPSELVRVEKPSELEKQLVPGNTQGAKHCLDSLAGVEIHKPAEWGPESLIGPCLVFSRERTIMHPTHGSVTVPAGFTVQCHYQREFDSELRRERRNAD